MPATLFINNPVVVRLLTVTAPMIESSVPLLKLTACAEPLIARSRMVSVPKAFADMPTLLVPMVNP